MSISDRERFLGICRFQRPGDLCYKDGFWRQTLREWVKQGAPEQIHDAQFRTDYFQFNHRDRSLPEIRSGMGWTRGEVRNLAHGIRAGNWGIVPAVPGYEPRIIEEDERAVTMINGDGQTVRLLIGKTGKMPTYLDWPVKDRASWNEYKKRLNPDTPERWPSDWDAFVQQINELGEQLPISLQVGGFYGFLREMIGSERILYMFYDDPALIEDMMDTMLYLGTEVVKRVVKDIRVDQAVYWEDMCYKAGPLISPDMFRKFMMPRYKELNDLLRSNDVDIIWLDSDGNLEQLTPLWLESGINFLWPFEVAAGNDAVAVRKKYGRDLIMGGTIDKRALVKSKEAIREEVMPKVPFLLEQGGYFPSVDHGVPPDVTFENYCYYVSLIREVAGLEKLAFD